ncbi:hypothetical protein HZ326_9472 [Fusarium oxysporum f. sp. albedinis]|jgi:hypothetical protein|nr:hypothetical protein HZ326_9472 [Fusarium oxysporum f. sp. albedinis]
MHAKGSFLTSSLSPLPNRDPRDSSTVFLGWIPLLKKIRLERVLLVFSLSSRNVPQISRDVFERIATCGSNF